MYFRFPIAALAVFAATLPFITVAQNVECGIFGDDSTGTCVDQCGCRCPETGKGLVCDGGADCPDIGACLDACECD